MLLKELTELNAVSGDENKVRDFIIKEVKKYSEHIEVDTLGNLIVKINQEKKGPKIMLTAHMDEVGFMIVAIESNGLLKFRPVGGIDSRVLVSKQVSIGKNKITGVIGAKAIHLQKPNERKIPIPLEQLFIDIGAKNKEDAEKHIQIGDYASFKSDYVKMNKKHIKAKALDDRVGCAILIDIIKHVKELPLTFVFTVQEEVGLRGASVAGHNINPDYALVIEATTASDVAGSKDKDFVSQLGQGPVLTLMDRTMIADSKFNKKIAELATEHKIKIQYKEAASGGNDAGVIHLAREGIKTGVLSLPVRYLHSAHSIMNLDDYNNLFKLTVAYLNNLVTESKE